MPVFRSVAFHVVAATGALSLLFGGHSAATPSKASVGHMTLALAPQLDAAGHPTGIDVHYQFTPSTPGQVLRLKLDTLEPMLARDTDVVSGLRVRDDRGVLPLDGPRMEKSSDGSFEVWSTTREAAGTIEVSYQMPVARPITPKRGPHFDLQAAGGGLSGGFKGFLLYPDVGGKPIDTSIRWTLPGGQRAISSLGDGTLSGQWNQDVMFNAIFLAGPITEVQGHGDAPFIAYALGLDAGKLASLEAWTEKAYDVERKAFKVTARKPYRLLVRVYDGGPIFSGRSTDDGFMLYMPPGLDVERTDLHQTLAHEMVHSLVGNLDDAPGEQGDWYTEGVADYFSVVLPFEAKLYTAEEYRTLVDSLAARYYTNRLRLADNASLDTLMWSGRNAWMVPYARGALYLADLDARLRARAAGQSALNLVNEMSRRIRQGAPQTNDTWQAVLQERVGTWAVDRWHAMMKGELLMPAPGTFGPCLTGIRRNVRVFDLGFARPVRLTQGETIGGVVNGSNAWKAGLRDGDVLRASVDINPLAESFTDPITLAVRRDGANQEVTYDPSDGSVAGMAWEFARPAVSGTCGRPN